MAPALLRARAGKEDHHALESKNHGVSSPARALRVGVVEEGRIIDEQVIRQGTNVTVGQSERSHIVIASPSLGSRQDLFRFQGGVYHLVFTDAMSGRLMLGDGPASLDSLREQGKAERRGQGWQIALSDDARGKIVIGETTLLFQMVQPPLIQPRPQLPAAVKSGWVKSINPAVAVILGLSFAVHFGIVTWLVHRDWPIQPAWQLMDEDVRTTLFTTPPSQATIDRLQETLLATGERPVNADPVPTQVPGDQVLPTKRPRTPERGDRSGRGIAGADPEQGSGATTDADRRARIAKALDQVARAQILGSLGPGDGVVADVLRGGSVLPDQDTVMEQVRAVGIARGDATVFRQPAGSRTGEAAKVDLNSIRRGDGSGPVLDSGEVGEERPVRPEIKQLPPRPTGGTGILDNETVRRIVGRDIGGIKGCYERELRHDRSLAGRIVISFTIGGGGRVTHAGAVQNTMGNTKVAQCVEGRFRRMRFPEPSGGNVNFQYPFLFRAGQ